MRKRKKLSVKADDDSQILQLLKTNLERRTQQETVIDNDVDRHFLLSLLGDFKRVPIEKKMDVKLAIIQAINSAITSSHSSSTLCNPYNNNPSHLSFHPSTLTPYPLQHYSYGPSSLSTQHAPIYLSSSSTTAKAFPSTSQNYPPEENDTPICSPYSNNNESTVTSPAESIVDLLTDYSTN